MKDAPDCPRCGQNHYDMSRPTVPTCPFKPQRPGPVMTEEGARRPTPKGRAANE
jgi:hypothetical protein